MYLQLMKDNRNAAALDSGLSLIAAGFSKYPGTRESLINLAGRSGAQQGHQLTPADIIAMQKQQQANKDMLLRRSMLSSLAKQYNMSPETALALETSGKLDEVLAAHNSKDLLKVKDAETDQEILVHGITGKEIARIGGPKPDQTQVVEGPNGQELRNIHPGRGFAQIGTPAGRKEDTQFVEGPNGPELRSKNTGAQIGAPVGKAARTELKQTPEGMSLINLDTGAEIAKAIGGAPTPETEQFQRADGSKFLRNKRTGEETEVVAPAKPGDVLPEEEHSRSILNQDRASRGLPPMSSEEFLKRYGKKGVTVNVGPTGNKYPEPEKGYAYKIDPASGDVVVDADGTPQVYPIPGAAAELARKESTLDIKKKEKAFEDDAKKEAIKKVAMTFSASNTASSVAKALRYVDSPGASGFGSRLSRAISPGGLPSDNLDSALNSINANTAFETLRAMRESSPNGSSLGNVSDFENKMLGSTIDDLRPFQASGELKRGLFRVRAAMELLAHSDFNRDEGAFKEELAKRADKYLAEHLTEQRRGSGTGSKFKIERTN
jgi:hypothetical protein